MAKRTKHRILAFVDAPDPDNFAMIIALAKLFPKAELHVALTGRPVRFNATKDHALWEWDLKSSIMAQEASALRIKNFLRFFGIRVTRVFDGGIAPRTLVPHHVHFAEYYKFLDADPLAGLRYSELEPAEELVKLVMSWDCCDVVVGGPMTGLAQMIIRNPETTKRITQVHAMFATWGTVELMRMSDTEPPRGAKQFNAYCDPQAAAIVLNGLTCPIYLMPTEVTRVASIGFQNAQALREHLPVTDGTRALYHLYALWYDAAVRPRQEKNPAELIFIHDIVGAFSLDPRLRKKIYNVIPIEVVSVPHLPSDADQWGVINMKPTSNPTNVFAATGLTKNGARVYLDTLRQIFV